MSNLSIPLPYLSPSVNLSSQQKEQAFLKAALVALNFLGCPTSSFQVSDEAIIKFVDHLFGFLSDRETLFKNALALPPPNFKVLVTIGKAEFCCRQFYMTDEIFCCVGTTKDDLKGKCAKLTSPFQTQCIPASDPAIWNEEFVLNTHQGDTSIVIEVWLKPLHGSHHIIGRAAISLDLLPCTGDKLNLFLASEETQERLRPGFISIRFCYQVEQTRKREDIIKDHLMLCSLCFENQINRSNSQVTYDSEMQLKKPRFYLSALRRILPDPAVMFLYQHALQNCLTPWENLICCWIVANRYFMDTGNVDVPAVQALLQRCSEMGKNPQPCILPEFRASIQDEIKKTLSHLLDWLGSIFVKIKLCNTFERDLENVLSYLTEIDCYYFTGCMEKAFNTMKKTKTYGTETLFRAKVSTFQLNVVVTERVVQELNHILNVLATSDKIFKKCDMGKPYSEYVYQELDIKLKNFLQPLMTSLSDEASKNNPFKVAFLMKLYEFLNRFVEYIEKACGTSVHLVSTDCHKWIAKPTFLLHAKVIVNRHSEKIFKWIEEEDEVERDSDPFFAMSNELLEEWDKICFLNPTLPTIALATVYPLKCKEFTQTLARTIINKNLYCDEEHFVIRKQLCCALNKWLTISKCMGMVKTEIFEKVEMAGMTNMLKHISGEYNWKLDGLQSVYENIKHEMKRGIMLIVEDIHQSDNDGKEKRLLRCIENYIVESAKTMSTYLNGELHLEVKNLISVAVEQVIMDGKATSNISEALQVLFNALESPFESPKN